MEIICLVSVAFEKKSLDYSSGSQPVCRGTLMRRELLPRAPRGCEGKSDYIQVNMQIKNQATVNITLLSVTKAVCNPGSYVLEKKTIAVFCILSQRGSSQ
jgi:hypothetical protein